MGGSQQQMLDMLGGLGFSSRSSSFGSFRGQLEPMAEDNLEELGASQASPLDSQFLLPSPLSRNSTMRDSSIPFGLEESSLNLVDHPPGAARPIMGSGHAEKTEQRKLGKGSSNCVFPVNKRMGCTFHPLATLYVDVLVKQWLVSLRCIRPCGCFIE